MTTTHRIRARLQLDVPKSRSRTDFITLFPSPIDIKWVKNNHLIADSVKATVSWSEAGVDPRTLKNGRVAMWLWDESFEEFDVEKHLRFTGIILKVSRKLHDTGWVVEFEADDFTTLFIHNKPMKTSGMPNYSDGFQSIWEKICDNTGWQDPANDKIVSSVEALRNHLVITKPEISAKTLGDLVPPRFRKVAKPTPKRGASSWDVWQWCVGSLGLISYIDKDECIITTTRHSAQVIRSRKRASDGSLLPAARRC